MNALTNPPSKEERLKFAFNIIDQEENRFITFEDLLMILQANYFAGTPEEVEPKAMLLIKETTSANSKDDPISYDDFLMLAKKYQTLFYPTNLQDTATGKGPKVVGNNVFNLL